MRDLVHDVATICHLCDVETIQGLYQPLRAYGTFLKHEWRQGNWKTQFLGHHSCFKKILQIIVLLAVKFDT